MYFWQGSRSLNFLYIFFQQSTDNNTSTNTTSGNQTAVAAKKDLRAKMVNAIAEKINPDADLDGKIYCKTVSRKRRIAG